MRCLPDGQFALGLILMLEMLHWAGLTFLLPIQAVMAVVLAAIVSTRTRMTMTDSYHDLRVCGGPHCT